MSTSNSLVLFPIISPKEDDDPLLKTLSDVSGWIYFFAWSISFYGQIYVNYKKKSVSGLSLDFIAYNLTGFTCYTIYTLWGYIDVTLSTGNISIQDIVFAFHALVMTLITIIQIFMYKDDEEGREVSQNCRYITLCIWWGFVLNFLLERVFNLYNPSKKSGSFPFNCVIYLGFSKVLISLIKNIPQAVHNYRRKSTAGWSIFSVMCDLAGGIFSLGQNIIDAIRGELYHWGENHSLNVAKFALSVICIFFDAIFIIQHYCLYPEPKELITGDERKLAYFTEMSDSIR